LLRYGRGVGCLHPLQALGDAPLEDQLAALCEGRASLQAERALECAVVDGKARALGKSIFETVTIPESHALVSGEDEFRRYLESGFTTFKVKGGRDLDQEARLVEVMAENEGVKIRLDFNEVLTGDGFERFWTGLPEVGRASVEFVEDPCPYDAEIWQGLRERTGVRLAVDRAVEEAESGMDVMVIKPAVVRVHEMMEKAEEKGLPVVFTSYMDHPVGQLYAALEAALAKWAWPERVVVCGLMTHDLFEGDAFCDAMRAEGPCLLPAEGTGLGFDELLESLRWERLI
jgi:O-succinylbenzoate synthase